MIGDKFIAVACLVVLSTCGALANNNAAQKDEDSKAATRTARNVFLPYYNNGAYYNPWNYNYNNYHHPYRHQFNPYPYHPIASPAAVPATGASRIPIAGNDYQSPILFANDVRHPDGSYYFDYETANGIRRSEQSVQTPHENVVQGSYSHVGPDGRTYTVNYIADKDGYRASGDHLPQQPQPVVHSPLSGGLHNHPIVVTTPRPVAGTVAPLNKPIVAANPFPAFDYRHPAYNYNIHPQNVYVSPYNPFSTGRPYLAAPVVHPYPLGKK